MSSARFLIGDVREVIAQLPDGSIDLVLTSPPFLALRSYLPADSPDKALEIGQEPTPGAYIDTLLDVVEAVRPKLARHGSLVVELGDTYAESGGAGGDYAQGGRRAGQNAFAGSASKSRTVAPRKVVRPNGCDTDNTPAQALPATGGPAWPLGKSLTLVPELFRLSLAYGLNPLTGRQLPKWRIRNNIRWCRPNPPVGALGDKFRPATSDMVIATLERDRYFDHDAVRTPLTEPDRAFRHEKDAGRADGWGRATDGITQNPAGAPLLDHWWFDDVFEQDAWHVPTQPYAGAHHATWPKDLLTRPILAMTPNRVCTTCGEPSRRIVDAESGETTGWTDCGHDTWRRGIVLDPFAGSGTTLAVATGHGRDAWGIDLDERNVDLARERVGMFLEVEDLRPAREQAS